MTGEMLAAVYQGNGRIGLEKRPIPTLKDSRDAIVKVTRSTLCTSDLHIRNGAVPRAAPGTILGHEFTGVVVETGAEVTPYKPGDRVAVNCETFCGDCWFCRRGFVNNCVRGGWLLGCTLDGGQAEYVRVPFADTGLTLIPDSLTDEDALFLGDILSSGYFGAELAEIHPGDCMAVLGAGPVGLCAAECARLFGAGRVVLLDSDPFRLETARKAGLADAVWDIRQEGAEEWLRTLTGGRGADAVIEAAGGQDSFQTAWKLARPNGVVALVAMYERAQVLPLPEMYGKNLVFKTGGVDACRCKELMGLLESGRLHTGFLITHRGPLSQILEGYQTFENRLETHCLKWVVTL